MDSSKAALVGVICEDTPAYKYPRSSRRKLLPRQRLLIGAMPDEEKGEGKAICEAKGYPCLVNCLCAPFVLCYQSCRIYFCACVFTYIYRCLVTVCCCICRSLCPSCYRYTDKAFSATAKSIGAYKDKSEAEVEREIEWQRAEDYFESKLTAENKKDGVRLKLFEAGVEPKDVAQGGLGDCWLISALACMSEHEGLLRSIFKTQEFNERGKYAIRLYDGRAKRWTVVTVDDALPMLKGSTQLLFAQPKGQELWVVLIEKVGRAKGVVRPRPCTRTRPGGPRPGGTRPGDLRRAGLALRRMRTHLLGMFPLSQASPLPPAYLSLSQASPVPPLRQASPFAMPSPFARPLP